MIFDRPPWDRGRLRANLDAAYRMDETACVRGLIERARSSSEEKARCETRARALVEGMRRTQRTAGGLDAFVHEYGLSSREGVVLMCLAEALLRVPDGATADRLIRDKLADADWETHLGHSGSVFVNASTWGLMLTGRIVSLDRSEVGDLREVLGRLVARSGEPIVRQALVRAMRILGRHFVLGRTIAEALARAATGEAHGYSYSYDMLGEAARTMRDADAYFERYVAAVDAIGAAADRRGAGPDLVDRPGLSVKLSALHPRFEHAQRDRLLAELVPRLAALAARARERDLGLTVDAEEADRLDITLDVFEAAAGDSAVVGWDGLGFVVQAYQKRCVALIDWLAAFARGAGRRMPVRLVKGAYWDSEIKKSQEGGFAGYPVFTRKASTDVAYLACARRLLGEPDVFYPQFATHNAHTAAAVLAMAGEGRNYEFQRLHGMGAALYDQIIEGGERGIRCRVYAPVGGHEDLLAYLVRRLLENGANTSFVNRIVDETLPVDRIIVDPAAEVIGYSARPHPLIPPPPALYGRERRNSAGIDLTDRSRLETLAVEMTEALDRNWAAAPIVGGVDLSGDVIGSVDPADNRRIVGDVALADGAAVTRAVDLAWAARREWDSTPADERAARLDKAADLYEANTGALMALCVREAGKTIGDAVAELREAVDFCRYYAVRARADFAEAETMPGPSGELNQVALHGRGVFACISPWNFPLAIFTGQVAAALAAGNAVVAKPAEQTPLIAALAVRLLHQAGIPGDVLHLLPGDGGTVGAATVRDPRLAGVAFTGSTETAWAINRALAARDGPLAALIAETGGQNAMIVDSTALPEQVVGDAIRSAFASAGQRCSALRVLFVQEEVAPRVVEMLAGAMAELSVGDPALLATDVGPVIDGDARAALTAHAARMDRDARLLCRVTPPAEQEDQLRHGTFFSPRAYEIDRLDLLQREVFGPILHVIRYRADRLGEVCDAINAAGYGLTLGIHSRIDSTADFVRARVRAGNVYVNRNIVGAVVGVQPFGGEGLSGTGPKAGGPRYLHRFATERTLSVDTAAAGGNAQLLTLDSPDRRH